MRSIPFSDNSAHVKDDPCTARRLDETLQFIQRDDMLGFVLDIGEPNYVGYEIWRYFMPMMDNSLPSDLNFSLSVKRPKYDTVLCLEVFEHNMNPLDLLCRIHNFLKPHGVLYLSTPVRNPLGFMFNETCHVTEYSEQVMRKFLEAYGLFEITDFHSFRSIPPWQEYKRVRGIVRTSLRVWSQRSMILRAVKR